MRFNRRATDGEHQASRLVCMIVFSLILAAGIIIFILWLSLRPHGPSYRVGEFSVQGWDHTNGFANAHVSFGVRARNPNRKIGIYYEFMNGSVYYREQLVGSAQLIYSPLFQEPKHTMNLPGAFIGSPIPVTDPRLAALADDRARGRVDLLLKLTAVIQYQLSIWDRKHHQMHAKCAVTIGSDGALLPSHIFDRCGVTLD